MTPVEQGPYRDSLGGGSRPGLAIGGGILAGLVTLGVVAGVLMLTDPDSTEAGAGGRPAAGQAIRPTDLVVGDCIEPGATTASIILRLCDLPHPAEVTGRIPFPDPVDAYPGAERLNLFVGQQCERRADEYLGADLFSTNLASDHLVPSTDDWADGDISITCYVARFDGVDLEESVAGRGLELPRDREVPVARLMVGDCFSPAGDVSSYDLNSNSPVQLVPCDGDYNGVFFGRGLLDPMAGTTYPGDEQIGQMTSSRCADLFDNTYGVPADGFNYRYWRPNQPSWNLGDRNILCAVLDTNPLSGRFDPAAHQPFFDLAAGDCFELGPEETDSSLGLDDQVLMIDCNQSHPGQMIGGGQLEIEAGEPYPGEDELKQLAGSQCEQLFEEFVGISPFESELVNFPFWYPNEVGWEQGDRRYACAFLDNVPRVGTLEGAEL